MPIAGNPALILRGCELAPDCEPNWDNIALMNDILGFAFVAVLGIFAVFAAIAAAISAYEYIRLKIAAARRRFAALQQAWRRASRVGRRSQRG